MTKEEFELLSSEDRLAEIEKCKDQVYFYNNYRTVNRHPVRPVTQEEWDLLIDQVELAMTTTIRGVNKLALYPQTKSVRFKIRPGK